MSNEQTPLLSGAKGVDGETPAKETPGPHSQDTTLPGTKHRFPQAIAHRGFKAAAPENSWTGFRAAVDAGAHALETDLHLSRDGVVVLSHDASLKRCFGVDAKVGDFDWEYLSTLRTLREPGEGLVRLGDLLGWLEEDGRRAGVWVMLDVKIDDDASELMQRTAETIASVPTVRPWSERILLCCWTAEYVKLSKELLPDFPVSHVGVSIKYARALADNVPGLGISLLAHALAIPFIGPWFIRDMRQTNHRLYSWTINDEDWMRWAIRQRLAGVITDDPKLFLDVCRRVAAEEDGSATKEKRGLISRITMKSSNVYTRVVTAPGRAYGWMRFLFFQVVISVIYMYRWGLPRTQVPKVLRA